MNKGGKSTVHACTHDPKLLGIFKSEITFKGTMISL